MHTRRQILSAIRGERAFFFFFFIITFRRLSGTQEDPVAIEANRENSFSVCDECPSATNSGESASLDPTTMPHIILPILGACLSSRDGNCTQFVFSSRSMNASLKEDPD